MENMTPLYIGIDVAKDQLDIAFPNGAPSRRVPNTDKELKKLVKFLQPLQPVLVVFEATGGYERTLAYALEQGEVPYRMVNPRNVHHIARGLGILAKSDTIDAKVLVRFAEMTKPDPHVLPDKERIALRELVQRRQQLSKALTQDKNRLAKAPKPMAAHVTKMIRIYEREIRKIEELINSLLQQQPLLAAETEVLQTEKGVGPVLATTLCGWVPELGWASHKQIAALMGLAPFICESGRFKGKRFCWGGRAEVRNILYMATQSAILHNPKISPFFHRLIAAGKSFKIAITACMRKLIVILNAKMRDYYAQVN